MCTFYRKCVELTGKIVCKYTEKIVKATEVCKIEKCLMELYTLPYLLSIYGNIVKATNTVYFAL